MTGRCVGHSATGDCPAPPMWAVIRAAGKDRTKTFHACGRHVGWLLRYVTIPGQTVKVTRLGP